MVAFDFGMTGGVNNVYGEKPTLMQQIQNNKTNFTPNNSVWEKGILNENATNKDKGVMHICQQTIEEVIKAVKEEIAANPKMSPEKFLEKIKNGNFNKNYSIKNIDGQEVSINPKLSVNDHGRIVIIVGDHEFTFADGFNAQGESDGGIDNNGQLQTADPADALHDFLNSSIAKYKKGTSGAKYFAYLPKGAEHLNKKMESNTVIKSSASSVLSNDGIYIDNAFDVKI